MRLIRSLYEANFVRLLRVLCKRFLPQRDCLFQQLQNPPTKILNFFPLRYKNKFPIFSKHSRVSCFTSSIQCQYQRIISTPKAFSIEFAEATQGSGIKDYRYPEGKLSEAHLEIVFQVTLFAWVYCLCFHFVSLEARLYSEGRGIQFSRLVKTRICVNMRASVDALFGSRAMLDTRMLTAVHAKLCDPE